MSGTEKKAADQLRLAALVLEEQSVRMDAVIADVASAHSCLVMDEILSLENDSAGLHAELLRVNAKLVKMRKTLVDLVSEMEKKTEAYQAAVELTDSAQAAL